MFTKLKKLNLANIIVRRMINSTKSFLLDLRVTKDVEDPNRDLAEIMMGKVVLSYKIDLMRIRIS